MFGEFLNIGFFPLDNTSSLSIISFIMFNEADGTGPLIQTIIDISSYRTAMPNQMILVHIIKQFTYFNFVKAGSFLLARNATHVNKFSTSNLKRIGYLIVFIILKCLYFSN